MKLKNWKKQCEMKEKEEVSKKLQQDSLILLKNDGVLPIKKGTKIAVIGPHADSSVIR